MALYTNHSPGRIVQINGTEYRYFGGTSYLGLQNDPHFTGILARNVKTYGSSHGASRLSNLRLSIFDEVEAHLASWSGSEAALTLSSGFLAGQLLSAYFNRDGYQTFYAPNAHSALMQAHQAPHAGYQSLHTAITDHLEGNSLKVPVLFMDSVDLSGPAYPEYRFLRELPLRDLVLVADDSHALGLLGDSGGGTYRTLQALGPKELVVCSSLGKALGLQGGVVFSTDRMRQKLWSTHFFAGASPAPPAHLATLLASRGLYPEKKKILEQNIARFYELWTNRTAFTYQEGYPVITYANYRLTQYLEQEKILVTDFPYPASGGYSGQGRIVLSAHHHLADLEYLADRLNAFAGPWDNVS